MLKGNVLAQEVATLKDFLGVMNSYEEIAAMRMRRVKKSVLDTREFLEGLNDSFRKVSYAYNKYLEELKGKKEVKTHVLNTNGKTVLILLSSNTGLYGSVIADTFKLFREEIRKVGSNTDIIIVGRLGKKMYDETNLPKNYRYFDYSDKGVDEVNLRFILSTILEYSVIVVYHGMFKSILNQTGTKTFVTGKASEIEQKYEMSEQVNFLFEPSIEVIAEYFEKEILSVIFEQVVFESSFSKFASRMISLYQATQNINNKIMLAEFALRKYKHRLLNSKQQTTLSSMSLWG